MGSRPRHNALLASWVTGICGGIGSPNFFCCGMLLLQAVIFSNCVTTEPPRGKREGVPCFWLVKDRPPKRATGSLITPERSSRVLESLRRDVLGKQVASHRIANFLFTCQNPTSSLHEHLLKQALLQFLPLRQLVLRLLDDLIHRREAVGDFALLGEGGNLHDVIQYHVWNNTLLTI